MLFQRLGFNRHSIVLSWFLSYAAVLLLPIVMSIFVYNQSKQTLENEIHQANNALLKQVEESMDHQLKNMQRLNFELSWNLKIQELLYSGKRQLFPMENPYDVYQITQDLKLYQSSYPFVDEFYIYLASDHEVLMPSVKREDKVAFQLLHEDGVLTYDQWLSMLNEYNSQRFIALNRKVEGGRTEKTVALVSSYPSVAKKSIATNVIMIDQSRILESIKNIQLFNKGNVLILNKENQVLVSNESIPLPTDFPYDKITGSSGLFYLMNGGEKYEVFYQQTDQSEMKFITVVPSRLYWVKAEQVRILTYTSIAISFFAGLVLTLILLIKNYSPIRRLTRSFTGKRGVPDGKMNNELQFIQQAIDRTFDEMDKMANRKQHEHDILRSHFLSRLLKGRFNPYITVDDSLAAFNLKFDTDQFAVLLFSLEEQESVSFFEFIQGKDMAEKRKLLYFIIANVVDEISNQTDYGYVTEVEDMMACLINVKERTSEEQRQELMRIASEAQNFLQMNYKIPLTVSISRVHHSIAGISQAYAEALDTLEYKLVVGSKGIISYEDMALNTPKESGAGYEYPLQVEQQLINNVKVGDFDKAKQTLDEIINNNVYNQVIALPLAKCLMFDLVSTMMKAVKEIGGIQNSLMEANPNWMEDLTQCSTIQTMHQQIIVILKQVCDHAYQVRQKNIQHTRQGTLRSLIENICQYIQSHYEDNDLNITMIGDHFDMKAAYLSKLFKEQTGEGLLDYINKIRIDRAKLALKQPDSQIVDVADAVGYSHVNTFIRTFKKYEGITPGKFKEMCES